MTEAAERAGVVNMVNLTYRNVAPLQRAREMVISGEIGTVKHVEASYLQSWLVSRAWGDWRSESKWLWRLSTGHGSNGVLGDIGIHILDFAAYGAATDIDHVFARLKTFNKAPDERIGEYTLDANDSFSMSVDFANGALGVVHASRWATGHLNELKLRIYGERGGLEISHSPAGSEIARLLSATIRKPRHGGLSRFRRCRPIISVLPTPCMTGSLRTRASAMPANLQRVLDLAMVTERERRELKV